MTTAIRPADARHQLACLRDSKDRAHEMYWAGQITLDQLEGMIGHINGEMAEVRTLAGWMS